MIARLILALSYQCMFWVEGGGGILSLYFSSLCSLSFAECYQLLNFKEPNGCSVAKGLDCHIGRIDDVFGRGMFCRQIVSPISRKMPEGLDLEPLAVKKHKSSEKKKQKVRDGEHGSSRILALEGLPRSEHIEGCAKIEKKKKKIMGELVEQTGPDLNNGDRAAAKEMNAHEAKQSKGRYIA